MEHDLVKCDNGVLLQLAESRTVFTFEYIEVFAIVKEDFPRGWGIPAQLNTKVCCYVLSTFCRVSQLKI